jgi:hypothetical protein
MKQKNQEVILGIAVPYRAARMSKVIPSLEAGNKCGHGQVSELNATPSELLGDPKNGATHTVKSDRSIY